MGKWQLGHLSRPGAREWAEAQGGASGVFLLSFGSFSFFFVSVLYFLIFISFSFSVLFNLGHLGIL